MTITDYNWHNGAVGPEVGRGIVGAVVKSRSVVGCMEKIVRVSMEPILIVSKEPIVVVGSSMEQIVVLGSMEWIVVVGSMVGIVIVSMEGILVVI